MAYVDEVLADNPVFYLNLDQTTGQYLDTSPNSYHFDHFAGTRGQDPVVYDTGKSVQAAGVLSQPVARRNNVTGMVSATQTIEAWVQLPSGSGFRGTFLGLGNSNGWSFGIGGAGNGGLDSNGRYLTALSNYVAWNPSGYQVPDGAGKYHFVCTRNGAAHTFFVNGAQVASMSGSAPSNPASWCTVGGLMEDGNPIRSLNDASIRIDSVALYNSALSSVRIAAHYQAGIAPPEPPSYLYLGKGGKTLHSDPAPGRRRVTVWAPTPPTPKKGVLWLDTNQGA